MQSDPRPAVNSESPEATFSAAISDVVTTAQNVAEKSGFATSEFWKLLLGGIVTPLALAAFDHLSPEWAAVIASLTALLWTLIRTRFKGEALAQLGELADALAEHAQRRAEFAATVVPPPAQLSTLHAQPRAFITPGLCIVAAAVSAVVILLTGCMGSGLKLPRAKVVYHSDFGSVSYDGKTLTTDFYGGEVAPGLSVQGGGKF